MQINIYESNDLDNPLSCRINGMPAAFVSDIFKNIIPLRGRSSKQKMTKKPPTQLIYKNGK
ncbi:MAG TPA: hypothetical protein DEP27_02725 [Ruminococcaceae bacterium]|nr:hypothetical protein [Oscillospiraceae bacterium]